MPNPDDERSLAGEPIQPQQHTHGDTVFGNPNGISPSTAPAVKFLSLAEVLSSAKRHRTVAHICLRADLQAEYDTLMRELASMVDGQGNLLPRQGEQSLDDAGIAALAQEKADRATEVRREMNAAMRDVEFEGMAEDKWRPWYDKHYPKKIRTDGGEPDLIDFNNRLIAEVAINPTLTVEEVIQLRSVLSGPQMVELANKAWQACTTGGVDIPKSPAFLRNLQLR
jgi:hypothetical protein